MLTLNLKLLFYHYICPCSNPSGPPYASRDMSSYASVHFPHGVHLRLGVWLSQKLKYSKQFCDITKLDNDRLIAAVMDLNYDYYEAV